MIFSGIATKEGFKCAVAQEQDCSSVPTLVEKINKSKCCSQAGASPQELDILGAMGF